jgi:hypothetical protein
MNIDIIRKALLKEVGILDAALNHQGLAWYDIRKAHNILKSQNEAYYMEVSIKLFRDIRQIYIDQMHRPQLYPHLDKALALAIEFEKRTSKHFECVTEPPLLEVSELEMAC